MKTLIEVEVGDERFHSLPAFPLDPATVARQAPDALAVSLDRRRIEGRCSLWWRNTPPHEGQRVGFIGHFAVVEAAAAQSLLDWAGARLAAEGCTLAIGPVDGNTWQRYRFITERGDEPPFFLEPDNPDDWPALWSAAGFAPLAHYCSSLNASLANADPCLPMLAQKLHDAGFLIRSLEAEHFEEELRRVHALSLISFRANLLYSPISEADFLEQYRDMRRFVRPDMCLLAEKASELAGYMFALPDLLQGQRGEPLNTVIVKTMAVHPDHGGIGLGTFLMGRCQEAARQAGFTRAIHALFHESNRSGRISSHTARVFRRYTLFARPLKERP
jgi:GNAT superfamily N-acetyltransferase